MSDQLLKRIAHLSPERREQLLRRLNAGLEPQQAHQPALPLRQPGEPCLLSFAQQRLWFLDQLDEQSSEYTVCRAIHLTGGLDEKILERCLHALVARHEILRTTFSVPEGAHEPVQIIASTPPSLLQIQDLTALPASQRLPQAQTIARAEALRPFDLAHGPLARFLLLRLGTEEHLLVLCLHHILADGWSLALALRELSLLYTHLLSQPAAETSAPLPPLALQFADYAAWQRHTLQGEHLNELLSYWQHHLQDAPFELALPTDHPHPLRPSHQGRVLTHQLSAPFSHQLTLLARREDVTPFMLLLTVFSILLGRLSGQHDLLIGTPIANRNREEIETLIGCVANTLVVRVRLGECHSFQDVLRQVRESTLQAYAHQELPFEKVVEALQPQRDLRRTPLFQVMFVFQNTPAQSLEFPAVQCEFLTLPLDLAKFDLAFSVTETEQGFNITVEYSDELFNATTIQRLLESYQILLESVLLDVKIDWHQLPLLSTQEQNKLLKEWGQPPSPASYEISELPLHRLFEEQVRQTPQAIALMFRDQRLRFTELNQRANQLAAHLRKYISAMEMPVGLCVERSPEMIIGLLAILKAGGYYVPLDPAYPQERLTFLMEDAQIAVLLTQSHLRATLPALAAMQIPIVCLDRDAETVALASPDNLICEVGADNLAYSIYTSGSTGRPKGVLVPHRGVSNVLHHALHTYVLQPGQQMMQHTSLSFDASVLEIFTSLLSGGCLHLLPPELAGSGEGLAQFINEEEITLLIITPSMLETVPYSEYPTLRTIVLGGESCPEELAHRWLQRYRLLNVYAPTETSIYMTQAELQESSQSPFPLGRPIGHMSVYVLDQYMQPVPIGVCGELYIGGIGVTRGYHHLPAVTAERFVPDPFTSEPGRRLYKTGDLACYLSTGELRFLGRDDDQVKIRGLRVELGEIETVLARHPRVQQAIVLLEGQAALDKQLIACFIPTEGPDPSQELRQFLGQSLPAALVPNRFVSFMSFPLNANGKIDRQGVQHMLSERRNIFEATTEYQAPRNPVEERLVTIWQQILGGPPIGIYDNFFQRGGHSLLATQIVSLVRTAFQIDLPLRALFETPTVAELAERIIQSELSQADAATLARLLEQLQGEE